MNFINTKKGFSKYAVGIIVACTIVYASALFWRYETGMFFIQGLVLLFVLMYASILDIRTRIVGDFVPVEILILSLICFSTEKILSSIIGAIIILVAQILLTLIGILQIGGADIKITTAAAFLLGIEKGIAFYLIGFVVAMLYGIAHSLMSPKSDDGIPMIPFFSIGILFMFLV